MPLTTRTLNPLHFEDLEPHRFEDMVRQLAYDLKEWKSIEATGRLGDDEEVDIRATEKLSPPAGGVAAAWPCGIRHVVEYVPGRGGTHYVTKDLGKPGAFYDFNIPGWGGCDLFPDLNCGGDLFG
jgi:hypothetical protein